MKRRKKVSKKKKIWNKKLIASIGIISAIILGLVYYKVSSQVQIKFSLKAAIIDQLGFGETQNPEFSGNATDLLEYAGFENVSYHKSTDVTVNFYQGLTAHNYGIIILRAHTALRIDNEGNPLTVDLFTSEKYTNDGADHYSSIYGYGFLVKGEYLWERGKFYFAITPRFVENLAGYFPKSIVIAMGCWSLKPGYEHMAYAFLKRGASAYIGWTDMVYPKDTDNETINLLNMLLVHNYRLGDAIDQTKSYQCTWENRTVITRLDFYPKTDQIYNLKISDLVNEVRGSATLQITANNLERLFLSSCVTYVVNHRSKDFEIYDS